MSNTNTYALLIRPGTRALSEEEIARRGDEVRTWAIGLRDQGKISFSRLLVGDQRQTAGDPTGVAAFVLIEAGTHDEAYQIGQSWPGIEYGGNVEVREAQHPPLP